MYLSRLLLDPRSRDVRRDLADCQEMHRTVMRAFPARRENEGSVHAGARARHGVLYRLDVEDEGTRLVFLVQSTTRPDWTRLPSGYLLETGGAPPNPASKDVAVAYGAIEAGQVLAFRVRA